MTDRVLVTGASGFIGYHLVGALLEQGDEVNCLVRQTSQISDLEKLKLSIFYGDVTQSETLRPPLEGVRIVYHLAAMTKSFSPGPFHTVNEQGTRNLVEACAEQETPPVVVVLSSIAAAGPSSEEHPHTEANIPAPVSNYGRSKLAGERAAQEQADVVPVTIVRSPIVFGEKDIDAFKIYQMANQGFYTTFYSKDFRASMIHAADLSGFLIIAAKSGERLPSDRDSSYGKGLYYISYGRHPTFAEFGQLVGEALDRKRVIILPLPGIAAWIGGAFSELTARIRRTLPSIINLDKVREAAAGSWTCSPDKARRQLGFVPSGTLEERLKQTATWYRDQGWL